VFPCPVGAGRIMPSGKVRVSLTCSSWFPNPSLSIYTTSSSPFQPPEKKKTKGLKNEIKYGAVGGREGPLVSRGLRLVNQKAGFSLGVSLFYVALLTVTRTTFHPVRARRGALTRTKVPEGAPKRGRKKKGEERMFSGGRDICFDAKKKHNNGISSPLLGSQTPGGENLYPLRYPQRLFMFFKSDGTWGREKKRGEGFISSPLLSPFSLPITRDSVGRTRPPQTFSFWGATTPAYALSLLFQ
jgi:hypothetical protein